MAWVVAVGTIPAVIVGGLGASWIDENLGEPWMIGIQLIIFGLVLAWADRLPQRRGIEQVNLAIGEMDQVTQQNAALVEEAAAAAGSLEEQARRLKAAVATFRVEGEEGRSGSADIDTKDEEPSQKPKAKPKKEPVQKIPVELRVEEEDTPLLTRAVGLTTTETRLGRAARARGVAHSFCELVRGMCSRTRSRGSSSKDGQEQ